MRKDILNVLSLLVTIFLTSCEYKDIEYKTPIIEYEMSFVKDIEPIFKLQSCTNCHSGSTQPDLASGKAYNSFISNGYIDMLNPTESKIYIVPKAGGNHPATFSIQQSQQLLTWIEQGAKNN
jgi:hypothetical protein